MFSETENPVFSGSLLSFIRMVEIALNSRLLPILKKKVGAYTEYFRRIFERGSKSKSKEKSLSASKRPQTKSASSALSFLPENDCQYEMNILLEFVVRFIKFNPLYSMYLREINIRKENSKNKEKIIERVFSSKKSSAANSKVSLGSQSLEFNKIVFMK